MATVPSHASEPAGKGAWHSLLASCAALVILKCNRWEALRYAVKLPRHLSQQSRSAWKRKGKDSCMCSATFWIASCDLGATVSLGLFQTGFVGCWNTQVVRWWEHFRHCITWACPHPTDPVSPWSSSKHPVVPRLHDAIQNVADTWKCLCKCDAIQDGDLD